jgi:hypothetical protein
MPLTEQAFGLKVIYNVYFRHRGIPTKLEFCWSDFALSKYTNQGIAHLKIEKLHDELGISLAARGLTSGDVVRIQPNHISFRSLKVRENIFRLMLLPQGLHFTRVLFL